MDKEGAHSSLEFTGERFLPGAGELVELEHMHRYSICKGIVSNKVVLDIACGEGYGSAILAQSALSVVGVDISEEAVRHATNKYQCDRLKFLQGSCESIPLESSSVDVVVSFETIEHHDKHEEMMREIKRVLKSDGFVVISSPDKLEYSDKPNYSNPYHVKELYKEEFKGLLRRYFQTVVMYGQKVLYGSSVICEAEPRRFDKYEYPGLLTSEGEGVPDAHYLIAVASNYRCPVLNNSICEQNIDESEVTSRWSATISDLRDQLSCAQEALAKKEEEFNRGRDVLITRLGECREQLAYYESNWFVRHFLKQRLAGKKKDQQC